MILFIAAVLPVAYLCYYVYSKDINKEPKGLLAKIFILGIISCIPAVIGELLLANICPTNDASIGFPMMLINVFISIALVEEGVKWVVTKIAGYNDSNFDEVYDIIVFAVFASLGFACLENILYVFNNGLGNALLRAITSIPGHASFGIAMGYYLSKARLNEINNNISGANKNKVLSLIIPALIHAIYDAILMAGLPVIVFFVFDIAMVVICFGLVNKMARVQYNLTYSVQRLYNSNINNMYNNQGYMNNTQYNPNMNMQYNNQVNYNYNMNNTQYNPNMYSMPNNTNVNMNNYVSNQVPQQPVQQQVPQQVQQQGQTQANFCPMCGSKNNNYGYCPYCGYKIK